MEQEPMTISSLVKEAYEDAIKAGFYDGMKPKNLGEILALIHCEVSETFQELRRPDPEFPQKAMPPVYYIDEVGKDGEIHEKPAGYGIELADVVIAVGALCGYMGLDLERNVREKLAYNKTREFKHGKLF